MIFRKIKIDKTTSLVSKHFDIAKNETIFEILLDGKLTMYTFNKDHKITDKCTWNLTKLLPTAGLIDQR